VTAKGNKNSKFHESMLSAPFIQVASTKQASSNIWYRKEAWTAFRGSKLQHVLKSPEERAAMQIPGPPPLTEILSLYIWVRPRNLSF
jgi:hypothetical protein